ncbi:MULTISPECIES: GNAT family N-acetyltransferase [Paenibacillus]|uniref:GNAT family N-acetyltransferase n=1 Tax=Paenibacillus campinasensis TaxID=66347 RepID=A0A268ERJ1_9BACL|nr:MULTISPECIES: GNAT family N-acetyltransferase [Paenibacillus]MUG66244.1 GNAT family N-acetyltransferase [Paenibacillus campinasensis]PAD75749.1 GNAT family N-acetyltransferase [Paenibacillus campinasensis]PAK54550.1 GNAT family N-acetyltransferase [Paenibacillus sp. 7541]
MLKDITSRVNQLEIRELLGYAVLSDPDAVDQAVDFYRNSEKNKLYGYEEEGLIIGVIGCSLKEKVLTIHHIAVIPENRGKDYGRGMILELLLHHQAEQVVAETDEEALGFYRSLGFEVYSLGETYPGVERFRCVYDVEEPGE